MSPRTDKSLANVRAAVTSGSRAPLWAALFESLVRILTGMVFLLLAFILFKVVAEGAGTLSWEFISTKPTNAGYSGGIFPAIFGTVCLIVIMIVMALPLGVASAVYLVEYSRGGILQRLARAAVNNLAGVPSIVFGLFGLGFFVIFVGQNLDWQVHGTPRDREDLLAEEVRMAPLLPALTAEATARAEETALRRGLSPEETATLVAREVATATRPSSKRVFGVPAMFWAAATLAILVLPVIIVATEEALRAVPRAVREAGFALGATKWQVMRRVVLPQAMPGVLTGAILAISRGAGELAPVLFVGVAAFKPDLPLTDEINFGLFKLPLVNPFEPFMHLNYHIYTLATQSPDPAATRPLQFGTTLVLLLVVLLLNAAAIRLRIKFSRSTRG